MNSSVKNLYEILSTEFIESGEAQSGTMMGFPSLRFRSRYFACKDKSSGSLIVKLPEQQINELIKNGEARPFAPAGQLFKTWAIVEKQDETLWRLLLQNARKHAQETLANAPPIPEDDED